MGHFITEIYKNQQVKMKIIPNISNKLRYLSINQAY